MYEWEIFLKMVFLGCIKFKFKDSFFKMLFLIYSWDYMYRLFNLGIKIVNK